MIDKLLDNGTSTCIECVYITAISDSDLLINDTRNTFDSLKLTNRKD